MIFRRIKLSTDNVDKEFDSLIQLKICSKERIEIILSYLMIILCFLHYIYFI